MVEGGGGGGVPMADRTKWTLPIRILDNDCSEEYTAPYLTAGKVPGEELVGH